MRIYFIIGLILLTGVIFESLSMQRIRKRIYTIIYILFTILLILFAGTRVYTGYDYTSYRNIFNAVQIYVNNGCTVFDFFTLEVIIPGVNIEPFYLILNACCSSFEQVLMSMAILGVGIKSYAIFKNMQYRFLCLFLYYCEMFLSFEMGVIRQGVAMGFMMLALFGMMNKSMRKFIIYVLLGACFHVSAFLMLPVLFIYRLHYKIVLLMLPPSILLFFLDVKSYLIPLLETILLERLSTKIIHYSADFDGYYGLLIRMIVIVIILVFIYEYWGLTKKHNVYINCFIYSIVFAFLFYNFSPNFVHRGMCFFYFSYVFVLDVILREKKNKSFSWMISALFLMLGIWHVYALVSRNEGIYYPYHSYLINEFAM